jgi:hypothetical protein
MSIHLPSASPPSAHPATASYNLGKPYPSLAHLARPSAIMRERWEHTGNSPRKSFCRLGCGEDSAASGPRPLDTDRSIRCGVYYNYLHQHKFFAPHLREARVIDTGGKTHVWYFSFPFAYSTDFPLVFASPGFSGFGCGVGGACGATVLSSGSAGTGMGA